MKLQDQLLEAIREENYELAAKLRDRIAGGETDAPPRPYALNISADWTGIAFAQFWERKVNKLIQQRMEEDAKALQSELSGVQRIVSRNADKVYEELLNRIEKLDGSIPPEKVLDEALVIIEDHRENSCTFIYRGTRILKATYDGADVTME